MTGSGALPWSKGTLLAHVLWQTLSDCTLNTCRRKNKSKAVCRAHPLGLGLFLRSLLKYIVLTKTAGHGAIPLLNTL